MSLISANSNIALLTPSRSVVVEPMRFVALTAPLQRAMLEWLEASEDGFQDVLTNTSIVGRAAFLYDAQNAAFLNRGALSRTLVDADARFAIMEDVVTVIGAIDRPRAYECYMIREERERLYLLALPVLVNDASVYVLTVDGW